MENPVKSLIKAGYSLHIFSLKISKLKEDDTLPLVYLGVNSKLKTNNYPLRNFHKPNSNEIIKYKKVDER